MAYGPGFAGNLPAFKPMLTQTPPPVANPTTAPGPITDYSAGQLRMLNHSEPAPMPAGGAARPPISRQAPINSSVGQMTPRSGGLGGAVSPNASSLSKFDNFLRPSRAFTPQATIETPGLVEGMATTPRVMGPLHTPITPSAYHTFQANGGVLPPEPPKPVVDMSVLRGNPGSTVGYSMGGGGQPPRSPGAPFAVPPSGGGGSPPPAGGGRSIMPQTLGGKIGVGAGVLGAVVGGYNATNELLDANSDPRRRFSAAGLDVAAGNYGSAAKNAYYGVGDTVGTFTGLKPFAQELANPESDPRRRFSAAGLDVAAGNYGSAAKNAYYGVGDVLGSLTGAKGFARWVNGKVNGPTDKITVDKAGNFSRAPTNAAEYKQMMEAKYGGGGAAPSYDNVSTMGPANAEQIKGAYDRLSAKQSGGASAAAEKPPMPYDEWVMKQPVSKLDAAGYARRAQLEIQQRAPETTQQNIMMATNYALSHPDMVTHEERHRDGSWAKTYGDRSANAMQGYGTFAEHLDNAGYRQQMANAAMLRAQNSAKFGADDKSAALTSMFSPVFDGVQPGTPLSSINDLPKRRAAFNQALIAASAMGSKLPWESFEDYADAQGYPLEAKKSGWFGF